MDKCFEIGVIQTFVDGELNSSRTEEVVRHISVCDSCALMVADVEADNDLVFESLGSELDYMVPTERLRENVFAAISEEKADAVVVASGTRTSWLAGLQALLTGRMATAMGALLIGFVVVGTAVYYNDMETGSEVASVDLGEGVLAGPSSVEIPNDVYSPIEASEEVDSKIETPEVVSIANEPVQTVKKQRRVVRQAVNRANQTPRAMTANQVQNVDAGPRIEGEPGYLTTIATLNRTVNSSKDYVLSPSERIEFEKNLAVVNNAISRMRAAVKKDPKNEGAKEVLSSSYKSKIDLLSSVANRQSVVTTD